MSYTPVGRCIYCGAAGSGVTLTKEHILPLSLGGTDLLPDASCKSCADVTSGIELKVSKNALAVARAQLKIRTSKPKNRPTSVQLTASNDHVTQVFDVPLERVPTIIVMPIFLKPGFWDNRPAFNGIQTEAFQFLGHGTFQIDDLPKELKRIRYTLRPLTPVAIARVLAKIAHGYAVAHFGHDGFEHFLPAIILGTNEDVGRFVGTVPGHVVPPKLGGLHCVTMATLDDGLIVAFIQLFACWPDAPVHEVVVGRLIENV